ncbi:hypothetical protein WK32_15160 [Burkholderia vietnamiensis]|nr:hypothetical protein WK32_15160 [Burkholderia vietnamiensis]
MLLIKDEGIQPGERRTEGKSRGDEQEGETSRSALRGTESVTAREAVMIVQNVVVDCRADSGPGCAARGAADESCDHSARESAEDRTKWSGDRANDCAGFRTGEGGCHATCRPCNAADRAARFAGAIARIDT